MPVGGEPLLLVRTCLPLGGRMPLSGALRDKDDGVTLAELMAAIAVVLVLVAIAIPTFFGATDLARDAESQSELRNALSSLKTVLFEAPNTADLEAAITELTPGARFDPTGVAGIRVERSADDAVCMWRVSESNAVYGIWEPPASAGETLYAELASMPGTCPVTADAATQGYTLKGWDH